jgi:hypothetical protein
MRKPVKLALAGVAAAAIAGSAAAGTADRHEMRVALPGGGTAHIQYYGKIAPNVTIAPGPLAPFGIGWAPMAFPDFHALDSMIARFERLHRQMLRHGRRRPGAVANVASFGDLPAGASSVTIVSVSNGSGTCTRTTRTVSKGQSKPPKVETSFSGNCSEAPLGPAPAAAKHPEPLDRA